MVEPQNPYAPPVETSDYAESPLDGGGLSISAHGMETVASMSRWMRIVGGLQYVGCALVLLGALFVGCQVASGGRIAHGGHMSAVLGLSAVLFVAYAVLLFLGATWLRAAAVSFHQGMLADHEAPLAEGFRKLRLYLILYGIFSVVGLVGQVAKLALAS